MDEINWGRAVEVALVGFLGVFTILLILSVTISITGRVVRLFEKKPEGKKEG